MKTNKKLSIKELRILTNKWQRRLEMTNWKIDIKKVGFENKNNYRKSGDFIANPPKKEATILMTKNPWRGDEEYTLMHEMLHILIP